MKTEKCINCGLEMKVDLEPYLFDEKGNNTARRTFYGTYACSEECEKKHDVRMRRSAERNLDLP